MIYFALSKFITSVCIYAVSVTRGSVIPCGCLCNLVLVNARDIYEYNTHSFSLEFHSHQSLPAGNCQFKRIVQSVPAEPIG